MKNMFSKEMLKKSAIFRRAVAVVSALAIVLGVVLNAIPAAGITASALDTPDSTGTWIKESAGVYYFKAEAAGANPDYNAGATKPAAFKVPVDEILVLGKTAADIKSITARIECTGKTNGVLGGNTTADGGWTQVDWDGSKNDYVKIENMYDFSDVSFQVNYAGFGDTCKVKFTLEYKESGSKPDPTMTISPTTLTVPIGETAVITETVTNGGDCMYNETPSDANIVAITACSALVDGVRTVTVRGVSAGTATITLKVIKSDVEIISKTCEVTVTDGSIPPKPDTGIEINETNFPDEIFRQYVSDSFDKDSSGSLSSDEIEAVKKISADSQNISDITGIEYFTALTELDCYDNQLTELDVSKNTELTKLDCYGNQLTALDVSKNTALTYLSCENNQLTELDVSKNTALTYLACFVNRLTALNVSKNTALTYLACDKNQLTALDVSQNTALTELYCDTNHLTALDVSKNTALTYFNCEDNKYTVCGSEVAIADLPGSFDSSKASGWTNAKVEDGKIISEGFCTATYTYDCGNNNTETFSIEFVEHTGGTATCTQKAICEICKEEYGDFAPHTLTKTDAVPATCTAAGNEAYWTCSACGKMFSDEDGTTEIQSIPTIPAAGHEYGMDWKSDEDGHWHECGCGDKTDSAAHTEDSGTVTKAPTETETGIKTYKCSVCGYVIRTETIPATGGSSRPDDTSKPDETGNISKDTQVGDNAPNAELVTPTETLAEAVLSPEERESAKNGENIKIVLRLEDGKAVVSDEDKAAVEAALNGSENLKPAQYLEINLYKILGGVETRITQTNKPVAIKITVPEEFRGSGREFMLVRIHDGETALLPDTDNDESTVTVETDRFSTYALVYKESASANNPGGNPNTGVSQTGMCFIVTGSVMLFIILFLTLFTGRNGMSAERKERVFTSLIAWGKKGGRIRALIALTAIFLLLSFYYGIGMKTAEK